MENKIILKIGLQIRNIWKIVSKIFQLVLEFFSVSGLKFNIFSVICIANNTELK